MNSQSIFGIAAVFVLYFTWVFYRGRNGFVQPARLALKNKDSIPPTENSNHPVNSSEVRNSNYTSAANSQKVRILSIHFNYNGHSFEAHEVLGLPPGSSIVLVEEAYLKAVQTAQPESKEFLDHAMEAVRKIHLRNDQGKDQAKDKAAG
jgi:hypothetical protein